MDQQNTSGTEGQTPQKQAPKRKVFARLRKWLLRLATLLLLLFLIVQLPFVQSFLAQELIEIMEDKLETEVSLKKLRVSWLDRLELQDLFIRDLHNDTLLQSGKVTANFNLNPYVLWTRGLEIEALEIDGAHFYISRREKDTETNINWAINQLFPPKEKEDDKKGLPFNINELSLSHVLFTQRDSVKGKFLSVFLPHGHLWIDHLDLANKRIDINTINLQQPEILLNNWNPIPIDSSMLDSILLEEIEEAGLDLSIGEFRLEDGQFILHNYRKAPVKTTTADQLDLKHLDLYDIQIEIDRFHYQRDTFVGRINWIAAKDKSGFKLERLTTNEVFISPKKVELNGLSIITPTSNVGDTIHFHCREYLDWEEFDTKVRMDIKFHDSDITLKDIMAFAPKLNSNPFFKNNKNTNLKIGGRFKGRINSLKGDDIKISLVDGTRIAGSFFSRNINKPEEMFLRLDLEELHSRMRTIKQLLPNLKTPETFDRLGNLDFSGEFLGYTYDFTAKGILQTELGQITLENIFMKSNNGLESTEYGGGVKLINFDLGGWSQNPNLGIVNFTSVIKEGKGLTGENMSAKLTASIEDFAFKNYTYKNANITGELNKKFFNGELDIQDKNIDFKFEGEVDFTDTIAKFDFKADVKRLALKELNLSKKDIIIATKLDINMSDTKLSKIEGEAKLSDIILIKDKTEQYQIDFINAKSFFDDAEKKVFLIDSDIATAEIRGDFDINELPASLSLFFLRNYPGFASRLGVKTPVKTPAVNQFDFDFHITDSKGINHLLSPKLGKLEDINLNGRYNGASDSLLVYFDLPYLDIGSIRLADIYLHIDAFKNESDLDIVIDSTIINGKRRFNTFTFLSILQSDTIDFAINISTDTPNIFDQVNLNGLLHLPDSINYQLELRQSNLSLLKLPWTIAENNKIIFGNGKINADNFCLYNQEREISVESHKEKGLQFHFNNFAFSFIDELWDYDQLNFKGKFDMALQVDDIFKLEGLSTAIDCDSFYINNDNFGAFKLNAQSNDIKSQMITFFSLKKDTRKLTAEGIMNLGDIGQKGFLSSKHPIEKRKGYLDLKLNFADYPLNIAEYWLGAGLSDTHGAFSANIRMYGMPQRFSLDGFIDARNGGFTIDALQTHYTFEKSLISMGDHYIFDASNTVLFDKYGNKALVHGGITHKYIKNMELDAWMETKGFLGLDLKKGDNDIFYGTAIGKGEVLFSGNFQQPNVLVDATVLGGTNIVIPITNQTDAQSLDFVKFVNKHRESSETNTRQEGIIKGLSLEMNLSVTEAASLELIFDEQAGDILRGQGKGDVSIKLPRAGEFEMNGSVEVTYGNYLFTLYDFINKDFRVKKGGTITWTGDPYNAHLDIEAEYKDLKASLSSLIPEYLLNAPADLKSLASQATDVDLTLILKGELFSPDISFDVNFPELRGQLSNIAENKLDVLRRNQSEMNRQVFGLVVIGQFLPDDLSISGNEVITNTLSEYFSNQISLLITQLFSEILEEEGRSLSSLDFEVAYSRYNGTVDANQPFNDGKAVEFSLRSGYFNDRLTVDLGGNFAFGAAFTSNLGKETFFGEDIVIEYALNDKRDLKIRLYERRDQDLAGDRRIQAGTGLSWQKEFNSFNEFWTSLKRKKKGDKN